MGVLLCSWSGWCQTDRAAFYGETWHGIAQDFVVFTEINVWLTFGDLLIVLLLWFNSFSKSPPTKYGQWN
jgi:hypothetical protein